MSPSRRLITATLLTLAVAACGDATGPAAPSFEYTISDAPTDGARGGGTSTPHYPLRHASWSPTLSAYQVAFWAKRGEERSVSVRYGNGNNGPTYLTFTVPAGSLDRGTDGKKLRMGDSVLIDLTLDPVAFQVEFQPSGLQFNNREPALLRVWYGYMDPDVNRDGVVDAADDALLASGMTYYHYDAGGINWNKISSVIDPVAQTVETAVGGFSGYVISW